MSAIDEQVSIDRQALARTDSLGAGPPAELGGADYYGAPQEASWDNAAKAPGINIVSLLHSLRRRWLSASILSSSLSSLVGLLLFIFIPVTFTATALINVRRSEVDMYGKDVPETDKKYEIYRSTQANFIKSPWIISAALRDPQIANLGIVRAEDPPIPWIIDHLDVRALEQSEILQLNLRAENAKEVEQLLNAIIKAYQDEIVAKDTSERRDRQNTLSRDYIAYSNKIRDLRTSYYQQLKTSGHYDTESAKVRQQSLIQELNAKRQSLNEVNKQLASARSELIGLAHAQQVQEMSEMPEGMFQFYLEKDPMYLDYMKERDELRDRLEQARSGRERGQIQHRLGGLEKKMRERTKALRPQAEEMWKAEKKMSRSDIQLRSVELNAKVRSYEERAKLEEAELAKLNEELNKFQELADFVSMKTELDGLTKTADDVKSEIDRLDLAMRNYRPRVKIQHEAQIIDESSWVVKLMQIASACVLVFGLCMAAVALSDYQGQRVNSASDVASGGEVRVLGSLPLLQRNGTFGFGRLQGPSLEACLHDSIDSVRAALLFNRAYSGLRCVLITSAVDQEGRTTLASQLAVSLARSGRRTLLVDGDIRNPQQHEIFGLSDTPGLCDLLVDPGLGIEDGVRPTQVENLWLLSAGSQYDDVQLIGDRAAQLFRALKQEYDIVVLETGPVLSGAEALLLGQHTDGVILSVKRDVSQLPLIHSACDRLRGVGIRIMGAVVHSAGASRRHSEQKRTNQLPRLTRQSSPISNGNGETNGHGPTPAVTASDQDAPAPEERPSTPVELQWVHDTDKPA